MKVDLSRNFKNLDGSVIGTEKDCCLIDEKGNIKLNEEGKPVIQRITVGEEVLNLKTICINSLLSVPREDKPDGKVKARRYEISKQVYDSTDLLVDLSAEEIAELKDLIGKLYAPIIVGQAYRMLEGKE